MKKSTLLHLRIPFSFFLLPVYLLAMAVSESIDTQQAILSFFVLHFLIYPASNGYNSYFDKDEKSIGGLKNPPSVSKELYFVSLILDTVGLIIGWFISLEFFVMILVYGLISKAYSHPFIRLKKLPITGWLAAGIFQGYFTFLLSYIAINDLSIMDSLKWQIQFPGALSTLLLLGSYPMTQIYQHEEDAKRGDITISQKLGILGTFHFTSISFLISSGGFFYFFSEVFSINDGLIFLTAMGPVLLYFSLWYLRVRKDRNAANFESTMRLNFISSLMLNGFFIYLAIS
ncbi:UbiA family prenyltransferase [Ekhidna sp.]|uniref:UbiA family prenyltransferase n=1 Tax=Ekhidna sp. TaxID=2608089 RepID=UPI003C7B5B2F